MHACSHQGRLDRLALLEEQTRPSHHLAIRLGQSFIGCGGGTARTVAGKYLWMSRDHRNRCDTRLLYGMISRKAERSTNEIMAAAGALAHTNTATTNNTSTIDSALELPLGAEDSSFDGTEHLQRNE
jgi:hypothetical protein